MIINEDMCFWDYANMSFVVDIDEDILDFAANNGLLEMKKVDLISPILIKNSRSIKIILYY